MTLNRGFIKLHHELAIYIDESFCFLLKNAKMFD